MIGFRVQGFRVPVGVQVLATCRLGTAHVCSVVVGARHYRELVCWQLSCELKRRVYAILARPEIAIDRKFCDQIRNSARSAPSNIAEGFARSRPADFRRFLQIARASIVETQNHIDDALDLRYVNDSEHRELQAIADRAAGATVKLIRYLDRCQ